MDDQEDLDNRQRGKELPSLETFQKNSRIKLYSSTESLPYGRLKLIVPEEKPYKKASIPAVVFSSYIDNFFKPITDKDLQILEPKKIKGQERRKQSKKNQHTYRTLEDRIISSLIFEGVFQQDRLSLDKEPLIEPFSDQEDDDTRLEARIVRNIKEVIGLDITDFKDEDMVIEDRIVELKKKRRHLSILNENKKIRIKSMAASLLSAQEYFLFLDGLEKRVIEIYINRRRALKQNSKAEISQEDIQFLAMYQRVKEKLGKLFPTRDEFYRTKGSEKEEGSLFDGLLVDY